MKRVKFECFNLDLRIYKKDEKEAFEKRQNVRTSSGSLGLSCENAIWIGESTVETCAHEAQHFVDYLLSNWLNIENTDFGEESEIKANIVGYVTQKVWDYVKD